MSAKGKKNKADKHRENHWRQRQVKRIFFFFEKLGLCHACHSLSWNSINFSLEIQWKFLSLAKLCLKKPHKSNYMKYICRSDTLSVSSFVPFFHPISSIYSIPILNSLSYCHIHVYICFAFNFEALESNLFNFGGFVQVKWYDFQFVKYLKGIL